MGGPPPWPRARAGEVTSAANLIDALDVHSATITTDNLRSRGANGKPLQKLATGA